MIECGLVFVKQMTLLWAKVHGCARCSAAGKGTLVLDVFAVERLSPSSSAGCEASRGGLSAASRDANEVERLPRIGVPQVQRSTACGSKTA